MWFSLGENHEKACRFADFLQAALVESSDMRLSSRKAACSSVALQSSTGNPGSVYTNRETALANIEIVNNQACVHHDVWRDGVEAPHMNPGVTCPEGEE